MSNFKSEFEEATHAIFHPVASTFAGAADAQIPSIDRPFGVSLWGILRFVTKSIFNYDIETFHYEYNSKVPMSRIPEVASAIIAYYVIIFGGRWLLKNVRPIKFALSFKIHNLLLTFLSGGLLLLLVEQMFPIIVHHGVFYSICNVGAWTQKVEFIYYLNYLTKYFELIDTIYMVLRKRPLTFLHTYHHGATALLCFSQLNGRTSVSYVPISLNLAVHVVMYFYYFLAACGIRPWWKTWVTRFQIIQFIIDLGFVYFATYTHFVSLFELNLPNMGSCAGEESAAVDGCLILTSYLVLFISFYIKSYIVPQAAKKAVREQNKAESVAAAEAEPAAAAATTTSTAAAETTRKRTTRNRRA